MSSNRLRYDTCAYKKELAQSTGPLSYLLNPMKYENCSKCRIELGQVGGTAVSNYSGNLVDLESDLRGQTRVNSRCPEDKWLPKCRGDGPGQSGIPCGNFIQNKNLVHLPPCQMVQYKQVPNPPPMYIENCPVPRRN